ncbi:MAG TPA: cellulase family glycosylhydrolase [Candidatus Sulfotelmatobacter sp.]|nr:cellulase family glycosylhydrolase [Candidatus Sulfotelmatobacter sp.]
MRSHSPRVYAVLALAFTFVSSFCLGQAVSSSVTVNITSDSSAVVSSETLQLTALIKNTPNVAVKWSATAGTITSSGLYHAPRVTTETVVTVTATSVVNPGKFDQAFIVVTAPKPTQKPQAVAAASSSSGSTAIKESFFGAGFNGFRTWPPTDGQKQVATLGGVRLWDDNVKWGQIETAKGVYDWSGLDSIMSKAQAQHVDVLYTIGDTPKWAGSIPPKSPCGPTGAYSCSAPNDLKSDGTGADSHFSDFVTALVKRYKGQIAYYELWNEPDCTCFWSGNNAQIVRMAKDAASIIRSTDPAAKIISPSAHGPTMATWFDGFIAAGGASTFDIVNAHLRGKGTKSPNVSPESFLAMYDDLTAETKKRNLTSLPVWDDEHGIKPEDNLNDPDELAGYAARSIALRAGVGIQRQYLYTWDKNMQGNDSGTAWDVVAGWLIGHSISPCEASGSIYTCNVDNGQIVWDSSKTCSKGVCTTSRYTYPTTYHNQTDLDGVKKSMSGGTVSIGYKPIFLTAN